MFDKKIRFELLNFEINEKVVQYLEIFVKTKIVLFCRWSWARALNIIENKFQSHVKFFFIDEIFNIFVVKNIANRINYSDWKVLDIFHDNKLLFALLSRIENSIFYIVY